MLHNTMISTLIAASAAAGVALASSQCNVPIDHPRSPSFDLGADLLWTKHELSFSTLTPPSLTRSVYVFGACGRGIGHDGTLEDREQCSPHSMICLTDINSRPAHRSEAERIVKVVEVAQSLKGARGRLVDGGEGGDYLDILITMGGEKYDGNQQSSTLAIRCDAEAPEPSDPTFVGVSGDFVHSFLWRTKHGCVDYAKRSSNNAGSLPSSGKGSQQQPDTSSSPPSNSGGGGSGGGGAGALFIALIVLGVFLGGVVVIVVSRLCFRTGWGKYHWIGSPRSGGVAGGPKKKFPRVKYIVFDGADDAEDGNRGPATPRTPLL